MVDTPSVKRMFISFKDDTEQIVSGYFDVIEEHELYLKFRTKANIVTISRNRIIKIKESL